MSVVHLWGTAAACVRACACVRCPSHPFTLLPRMDLLLKCRGQVEEQPVTAQRGHAGTVSAGGTGVELPHLGHGASVRPNHTQAAPPPPPLRQLQHRPRVAQLRTWVRTPRAAPLGRGPCTQRLRTGV
jgi:hypothetical protein